MIKEFAVDPKLIVRSYADLKYVIEKFGVSEGRVISEFPRKWRRSAYEAALQLHRGKAEYAKIEEKLKRIPKSALLALGRQGGEGGTDWFELALAEHARQPFDYILAPRNDERGPCILLDDFEAGHPCLSGAHDREIRREASEMAKACALLLQVSKQIKLIDPYFDLQHQRYVRPFGEFLKRVGTAEIEIHRADTVSHEVLRHHANRHLPLMLPLGVKVRMFTWPKNSLHNRFVISEVGGITFGTGLDEASPEGCGTDYVSLMSEAARKSHWEQYSGGDLVQEWSKDQ